MDLEEYADVYAYATDNLVSVCFLLVIVDFKKGILICDWGHESDVRWQVEFHTDAWRYQLIQIRVFEGRRIFRVCVYVALSYDPKGTHPEVDEGCPSCIGEK